MNVYAIHSDSLRALQNELGEDCPVIYYNAKNIRVLPGSAKFKSNNSEGGNSYDADFQCVCLLADFGENFNPNGMNQQTFNYPNQDGKLYRVKQTEVAPNSLQLRIYADDASEGL